jgi:hypothetical protein
VKDDTTIAYWRFDSLIVRRTWVHRHQKAFLAYMRSIFFMGVLQALLTETVWASGSVTLAWNPSPNPVVAGYNVYYGGVSGIYTNKINAMSASTVTISNLTTGATYYFAATTYSAAGVESAFSGEFSYQIPVNTVVTNPPLSQMVMSGGTATLNVAPGGTPPWSYQWSFNGTNLLGATNSTLTLNNVDPSLAGSYAVSITDRTGSTVVSNLTLTVAVPPMINGQPASQSVMTGCDATIQVLADGTGPLCYQWWNGSQALPGQTNPIVTLTNVQSPDFGSYCVVVTNVFGASTSSPAQLALGGPPVANPDTIYRFALGGVRVNANVLLANDTVAEFNSLTVLAVNPVSAAGGAVGLTNNWVYYAPPAGSTTADTFTYTVSDGHCGQAEGTVTVNIKAANPEPTTFGIAVPGDGSIQLSFDGMPGYNYRVLHSDTLFNPKWQSLGTQPANALGVCQFVDWSPTNAPAHFYRAVWP